VGQISPKHFLLLHAKIDLLKLKGSGHPSRKNKAFQRKKAIDIPKVPLDSPSMIQEASNTS
jgi:hypothetical protein